MKPPDTISSFCAFLFGLMGALFVLLSMLFVVTGVPVNGGPTWFLLPIGIIFLLTGLGFVLKFQQQKRRIKRLKAEGVLTTGEVQSIRHLVWINWNTSTFVKRPGQCSPWVVQCSYEYQGQTYIVRNGLFWAKPSFRPQQPAIYFDPQSNARLRGHGRHPARSMNGTQWIWNFLEARYSNSYRSAKWMPDQRIGNPLLQIGASASII